MAFTDIDATKPVGTEKVSTADNYIRQLKVDIETNLAEISGYPSNSALKNALWTTEQRPSENLSAGLTGYNTTTGMIEYYDGSSWKSFGNVPVGGIILWSGEIYNIPSNWQICDGTNNTPDLRDKFVIGAGNNYAVDANDIPTHSHSTADHALSISEMPRHSHGFVNGVGWNEGSLGDSFGRTDGHNPQNLWPGIVSEAGGGEAHNHGETGGTVCLPPYYALAYIIRIS